jgi:hypothetical protein
MLKLAQLPGQLGVFLTIGTGLVGHGGPSTLQSGRTAGAGAGAPRGPCGAQLNCTG